MIKKQGNWKFNEEEKKYYVILDSVISLPINIVDNSHIQVPYFNSNSFPIKTEDSLPLDLIDCVESINNYFDTHNLSSSKIIDAPDVDISKIPALLVK